MESLGPRLDILVLPDLCNVNTCIHTHWPPWAWLHLRFEYVVPSGRDHCSKWLLTKHRTVEYWETHTNWFTSYYVDIYHTSVIACYLRTLVTSNHDYTRLSDQSGGYVYTEISLIVKAVLLLVSAALMQYIPQWHFPMHSRQSYMYSPPEMRRPCWLDLVPRGIHIRGVPWYLCTIVELLALLNFAHEIV